MRGIGTALTALIHGSVILTRRVCGCAVHGVRLAWDAAAVDPQATVRRQAKADAAAREKAAEDGATGDLSDITARPVAPVRRPAPDAGGILALGAALAAGAVSAAWRMAAPSLGEWWTALEPYHSLIISGAGLAWMAAAWMIAPPPADEDDDQEEWDDDDVDQDDDDVQEDADDAEEGPEDRGTALLWHVIRDLSDAEYAKRAGVHVDVLLDSARAAGHVPGDADVTSMREWLEAAGIPVTDKVGMRIEGKPVTRTGVRLDAVTAALGMTPTTLLNSRTATAPGGGPAAPAGRAGETPAETPSEAPATTPATTPAGVPVGVPAPAVRDLIPSGRQPLSRTPSPTLTKKGLQGAR